MIEIKERGILFSSEMVRAILDNRKTETRRVMNPQPSKIYSWLFFNDGLYQKIFGRYKMPSGSIGEKYFKCPYGGHRDILYVREAMSVDVIGKVRYKADMTDQELYDTNYQWTPSFFMKKKYSRIKLKIKEIRVERIQDITPVSMIDEGDFMVDTELVMPGYRARVDVAKLKGERPPIGPGLIARFKYLWNSLNYKRGFGWDKNPYVWVIKFERIK